MPTDYHALVAEQATADFATDKPRYTGSLEELHRLQREAEDSVARRVAGILPCAEFGPAVFDGFCHTYKRAFAAARKQTR